MAEWFRREGNFGAPVTDGWQILELPERAKRRSGKEKRFHPNNCISFTYKLCFSLTGVSQYENSLHKKNYWSENTRYSKTISEKCTDLEETTSILKLR